MTPPARTAEHDAFGPWILPVRTPDEVPRAFRSHGVDPAAARLALKVPRDVARRDTDPTMDLYDRLLVVGERDLEVLTRVGSGSTSQRIPFAALVGVRDRVDLLDGLLTLHAADGTAVAVPYNGASADVVADLTSLLVGLASATAAQAPPVPPRGSPYSPRVEVGADEAGVASEYWRLAARDPDLRFLSSHPRIPLHRTAAGLAGALRSLRPMSLAGAIAACTPREVLVVTRRDQVIPRRLATLSLDRLRVLRHAITSTTSEPHRVWAGMSIVTVHAGAAAFEVVTETTAAVEGGLLTLSC
ncbi:hypothetical protein [Clavibacter zhangzhiyongii]|uniref:hypothetical protein n=1 Tax=Clavibacter zhangzhiyongii TaxID=2768071 RepID=UPI0039E0F8E3